MAALRFFSCARFIDMSSASACPIRLGPRFSKTAFHTAWISPATEHASPLSRNIFTADCKSGSLRTEKRLTHLMSERETPVLPAELRRLLHERPNLHWSTKDGLTSWGIQPSFLEWLAEMVRPGSLTLETGTGLSTIAFAIIGTRHVAISPAPDEHARIEQYCRDSHISTEHLRFIAAPSHACLPTLDLQGSQLDFALIDGAHAFPQPVIDYFYVNGYLKVGGLLAIDDLQITSVGLVHRFLMTEPAYELVEINECKTGIYRKLRATSYPRDFASQTMNRRNPDFSFLPPHLRIRQAAKRLPGFWALYRLLKG